MDYVKLAEMLIQLILVPIVMWGLTIANSYLTKKLKIEQVASIWEQTYAAVEIAVAETSQVFVDVLKDHGNFSEVMATEAFLMSKQKVLEILTPRAQELLENSVGDVNAFINALIEAEVAKQKEGGC